MALGMVAPVLPKLVTEFLQQNTTWAAVTYGLFNAAFALFCSFSSRRWWDRCRIDLVAARLSWRPTWGWG